jgi:hypothetical protein
MAPSDQGNSVRWRTLNRLTPVRAFDVGLGRPRLGASMERLHVHVYVEDCGQSIAFCSAGDPSQRGPTAAAEDALKPVSEVLLGLLTV